MIINSRFLSINIVNILVVINVLNVSFLNFIKYYRLIINRFECFDWRINFVWYEFLGCCKNFFGFSGIECSNY